MILKSARVEGVIVLSTTICLMGIAAPRLQAGQGTLDIRVDPRLELLAAVQLLAGYGETHSLITRREFAYKREFEDHFSDYSGHEAVRLFKELAAKGFAFDRPPNAALRLSEPPELEIQTPFTPYLYRRLGGVNQLTNFVEALRDFVAVSSFLTFFEEHGDVYARLVSETRSKLAEFDDVAALEGYYGKRLDSYSILLAPMFHDGGFGIRIEREGGLVDVMCILGPRSSQDSYPDFGGLEVIRKQVWHEFSHSFLDHCDCGAGLRSTGVFQEEIGAYKSLYEPIAEKMKRWGYNGWSSCAEEHLVRMIVARLTARWKGEQAARQIVEEETEKGFVYVRALHNRLQQYESQRERYPTFTDFCPRLLDVFRELTDE